MIEDVVRHAFRKLPQPPRHLGVAVSGGADSVCLLHVLFSLAPEWGVELRVLHLNHQLRGEESDGDEQFVAEMAQSLGLSYRSERVKIAEGENLEQAAREARLAFFARARQGDYVATGHTADDQAETVLFRFLRGSGPGGLAGILPVTAEGLWRPMLEVRRQEIREWLSSRSLPSREDSTNTDARFARNRLRRDLLPALEREWNPNLAVLLGQTAMLARADEEYMEAETSRAMAGLGGKLASDGAYVIPVAGLVALPEAIRMRCLRRAVREIKGDLRGIEFQDIRRVMTLLESQEGSGRLQVPGVDVMRSFDWVRFVKLTDEPGERNWRVEVPGAGRYHSPGGEVVLEQGDSGAAGDAPERAYNEGADWVDLDRFGFPLDLRNWRPGDSYQRVGANREERLKELFQTNRVPLWERRNWPMITKDDEILWVHGFGPSQAAVPVTPGRAWRIMVRQK